MKWYKAYFDAPAGNEPLALDLKHMVRGQVWINGQSIGRYWTKAANGTCGIFKKKVKKCAARNKDESTKNKGEALMERADNIVSELS